MSPVKDRHGKVNARLGAFVGEQRGKVAALIAVDLETVAKRLQELHWMEPEVEDGVVTETLVERFIESLTGTAIRSMETRIMRAFLVEVCGPQMLSQYQTVHRRRIVEVMREIRADGYKIQDCANWPRRLEDGEHHIGLALFERLDARQLKRFQRKLNGFADDHTRIDEALKAAGPLSAPTPKRGTTSRRAEPEVERYRKATRDALRYLSAEQLETVERQLATGKFAEVAQTIAAAVA